MNPKLISYCSIGVFLVELVGKAPFSGLLKWNDIRPDLRLLGNTDRLIYDRRDLRQLVGRKAQDEDMREGEGRHKLFIYRCVTNYPQTYSGLRQYMPIS